MVHDDATTVPGEVQRIVDAMPVVTNSVQLAGRVLPAVIFGPTSADRRVTTEASLASLDGAAVRAFHKRWFRLYNARLVTTGNVGLAEVRPLREAASGTRTTDDRASRCRACDARYLSRRPAGWKANNDRRCADHPTPSRPRRGVTLGLTSSWSTSNGIASYLADQIASGLPEAYYPNLPATVATRSVTQVNNAASTLIRERPLPLVVIDDRVRIGPALRAAGLGEVRLVDGDGLGMTKQMAGKIPDASPTGRLGLNDG